MTSANHYMYYLRLNGTNVCSSRHLGRVNQIFRHTGKTWISTHYQHIEVRVKQIIRCDKLGFHTVVSEQYTEKLT